MKKFFYLLIIPIFLISFVSCSDDDDIPLYVGEWHASVSQTASSSNEIIGDYSMNILGTSVLSISELGTYSMELSGTGYFLPPYDVLFPDPVFFTDSEVGTYIVNDNFITFKSSDGTFEVVEFTCSGNKLTLRFNTGSINIYTRQ